MKDGKLAAKNMQESAENEKGMHEMSETLKRLDIYKVFAYFLTCAWIGWIWETLVVWAMTGELTDRGFLFIVKPLGHYFPVLQSLKGLTGFPLIWGLPVIGIYGVGGALVCSLLNRRRWNTLELFSIGLVSLTLLELLASYLCDWLLHRKYWDYTGHWLSFQGRICLYSALSWGFLCVVAVKVVAPVVDRIYAKEKTRKWFQWGILALMLYVGICALVKYWINPTIIAN